MLSKVNDIKNCEAKTKVYLGLFDKIVNAFKGLSQNKYDKYFNNIVPAYGHAQARMFPDLPYLVWTYEYDYSDEFNGAYKRVEIDNKERFSRAFHSIKKYTENYLTNHQQYFDSDLRLDNFDLDMLLDTLVAAGTDKTREKNWQRFLIEQELFDANELNFTNYEADKWLKEAFSNYDPKVFADWKVEGVQLADNFINSHWYRFYLASKWYKQKFFHYCSENQLDIPN